MNASTIRRTTFTNIFPIFLIFRKINEIFDKNNHKISKSIRERERKKEISVLAFNLNKGSEKFYIIRFFQILFAYAAVYPGKKKKKTEVNNLAIVEKN